MPKGLWWMVEIASLGVFLFGPALLYSEWAGLPDTVPTHFGLDGTPNATGGKSSLLVLCAVNAAVYALLSASAFYPNLINLPGPRTPAANATRVSVARVMKLEISALFSCILWGIIEVANGRASGLCGIAMTGFAGVLLVTAVIGVFATKRHAH